MANILGFIHPTQFEIKVPATYPHAAIHSEDPLVRNLVEGDIAYVAVARPDGSLFLIYVFEHPRPSETGKFFAPNTIPVTDITSLRPFLSIPEHGPSDRPFVALSAEAAHALEAIWRPIRAAQAAERERTQKEWEATEKARKAKNAAAKKAAKAVAPAKPSRTETFAILVAAALAQIEEVAGDVQDDAEVMLLPPVYADGAGLRGRFTETVQSIFEGGIDADEGLRLLSVELSPFVDGAGLAIALRGIPKDTALDALLPKLVDAFATRAVDDLARTLVALASGKKKMIPARCEELLPLLEADVERARELIG